MFINLKSNGSARPAVRAALMGSALFAGFLAASPALADYKAAKVKWVSPNSIAVESNGQDYTKLANLGQGLAAEVDVEIEAGLSGYIKNWSTWLGVATEKMYNAPGNNNWVEFKNHGEGDSYGFGSFIKIVAVDPTLTIPPTTLQNFAVAQCNVMADDLRSGGMPDQEIFGQDRVLPIATGAFVKAKISGVEGTPNAPAILGTFDAYKKFDLICKKDPNPAPVEPEISDEGPTRNVVVSEATLLIQESANLVGDCRLHLNGVIKTHKANEQVQFRYVDDKGKKSSLKTVETDHTKQVIFHHEYALAGVGLKQGSVRIDIKGEKTVSPWTDYEVTCRKNAPNSLAGNTDDGGPKPIGGDKQADLPTSDPGTDGPIVQTGNFTGQLPKPDLMATPLGMSLAGGKKAWGSTVEIDNPAHAQQVGVGPGKNLCRFSPAGFRPFNKGLEVSGPFKIAVRRGGKIVHQASFNLAPQSGLPGNGWHMFDLDLKQGNNQIKVVLDNAKSVDESDEGNNVYTLKVKVNFPCTDSDKPGLAAPSAETSQPGAKPGKKIGKRFKKKLTQ